MDRSYEVRHERVGWWWGKCVRGEIPAAVGCREAFTMPSTWGEGKGRGSEAGGAEGGERGDANFDFEMKSS